MERAPRPAVLDVRAAADGNAVGATITVDGSAVGSLPNRIEVGAGNHVVEVSKQGFNGYRDNLQVAEGETRTVVVPLQAQVKPGSLLVTADAPGAVVFVDGVQKDTAPTVIGDLPEGAHTVEVRAPNMPPWKQVVTVVAGQQIKVAAQVMPATPPPPATGSLRVVATPDNATLLVDGEAKGQPGIEIKNLEPGSHVVEVRAQGFTSQRVQVDIAAGHVKTILIDLVPARFASKNAGLRVISAVPDVEVFLDGASVGKTPVERNDLAPGKHFVVARKPGFADFKVEVDLQAGGTQEVAADLRNSGGLRVISNPAGASVFLDGTLVGVTPITLPDVAAGPHVVEMKLKDHADAKQSINVDGGAQGIVSADLLPAQKGPTTAEVEKTIREQTTWGAMVLDRGRFSVDAGTGYPYYFFLRLQAGIVKWNPNMGFDLGIEFRTFFYDNQIGIRPRVQLVRIDPFGLAVDFLFLGGGGPSARNSFNFEMGAILTLAAGNLVHVNLRPYLAYWTDRLCPAVSDINDDDLKTGTIDKTTNKVIPGSGNLAKGEQQVCKTDDTERSKNMGVYQLMTPAGVKAQTFQHGQVDPRERFAFTRFMLQLSIEIAILKNLNLWAMIEGAPFQDPRDTFSNQFSVVFPSVDSPSLYGGLGITGKF
jgi:hypothetical protein